MVSNFINPTTIGTIDFYDKLLYKYYGKVYYGWDKGEGDFTVIMYYWDGKFYVDGVKYE